MTRFEPWICRTVASVRSSQHNAGKSIAHSHIPEVEETPQIRGRCYNKFTSIPFNTRYKHLSSKKEKKTNKYHSQQAQCSRSKLCVCIHIHIHTHIYSHVYFSALQLPQTAVHKRHTQSPLRPLPGRVKKTNTFSQRHRLDMYLPSEQSNNIYPPPTFKATRSTACTTRNNCETSRPSKNELSTVFLGENVTTNPSTTTCLPVQWLRT